MIKSCHNCYARGLVFTGWVEIECPKCEGSGFVDRIEQVDWINKYPDVIIRPAPAPDAEDYFHE